MKWSDFVKQVNGVLGTPLDNLALKTMLDGNVPSWMGKGSYACFTEVVIDGLYYRCDYNVMQNYLAIGEDNDWGCYGLTEPSLQAWCDHPLGGGGLWFIPTRKLVKTTWRFSTCKLGVLPIVPHPGEVIASGINGFAKMQEKVNAAMAAQGCSINTFNRARKAYIAGPGMDGQNLYFYGWFFADGSAQQDNPHGGSPHPAKTYSDYSHGCDVVLGAMVVNGVSVGYEELCAHPHLWPLVSDDGPFAPRFPNKGIILDTNVPRQIPGAAVPASFTGDVYKTQSGNVQKMSVDNGDSDVVLVQSGNPPLNASFSSAPNHTGLWLLGLGALGGLGYLAYRSRKRS